MEEYFYIIIVAAVFILLFFIYNKSKGKGKTKGRMGERRTAAILKKFSRKNKCLVINGIWLPLYNSACEVDHIVFGNFGVAVIETKAISGKLSGSGKYLTQRIGNREHKLYNPNLQNKVHADNIRHHLLKAGFKNIPIFEFTVFTDDNITLASKDIGIKLSSLYDSLGKLPPKKYDYKGLYKAISAARVRNPFRKILHRLRHLKYKNIFTKNT